MLLHLFVESKKEKYKINENPLFIPDRDLNAVRHKIPNNRKELKYEWEE